jgi:hypothetical protein
VPKAHIRRIGQVTIESREHIDGPEHPSALTARAELAYWTGRAGDATAARDQLAALLPIRERVLGPEHPDTLVTRQSCRPGPEKQAMRRRPATSLPHCCRYSKGFSGLSTWRPSPHMATSPTGQDEPATPPPATGSLPWPIRQRVSGPEHPETLTARAILTRWTGEAGDAATARDQFATLLPIRERVSGPRQRNPLATRQNLALWAEGAGKASCKRSTA